MVPQPLPKRIERAVKDKFLSRECCFENVNEFYDHLCARVPELGTKFTLSKKEQQWKNVCAKRWEPDDAQILQ